MDHETELRRLRRIADWMDSRFSIPGTGIRFGLDSIVGIVPFVGDGVVAIPALYLIIKARQLGASKSVIARMLFNLLFDVSVGAIPILGDLFDVGFKSNRRNVALLQENLENRTRRRRQDTFSEEEGLSKALDRASA